MNDIVNKIEGIGTAFDKYRDGSVKAQAAMLDRIEDLEARASQPGKTGGDKYANEHVKMFSAWVKKPTDANTNLELSNFERDALGRKDVTVGSSAGGGYAVPEEIGRQIGLLQMKYSPVRSLVRVVQTGTSDYKELIDLNGTTSGWVGETDSRSATNTSTLREVAPTHGELYAYPQMTEWAGDDMFFNVEQWISDSVARSFAIAEAEAVIRGNGTNKPTGMINTPPVTTADDAGSPRSAVAYQYLLGSDNSPASIDADSMIDLYYTVNSAYRANGTWVMNSVTMGQVRKLKDNTNQYLWQPSLQAGQPDMFLGRPVVCFEQMDDPLGGKFPVAFGDFQQGYLLVDRVGLRITRDPFSNPGFVRFYVRKRVGGKPLNNDAVKWLKLL